MGRNEYDILYSCLKTLCSTLLFRSHPDSRDFTMSQFLRFLLSVLSQDLLCKYKVFMNENIAQLILVITYFTHFTSTKLFNNKGRSQIIIPPKL